MKGGGRLNYEKLFMMILFLSVIPMIYLVFLMLIGRRYNVCFLVYNKSALPYYLNELYYKNIEYSFTQAND